MEQLGAARGHHEHCNSEGSGSFCFVEQTAATVRLCAPLLLQL